MCAKKRLGKSLCFKIRGGNRLRVAIRQEKIRKLE